jgi:hypothetical protein
MAPELSERITRFLETRVEGDQGGGWVAPSREDFDEFYNIIAAIRDAKWDRDGDGDPTIEIRLTDRSIGRHPWVPYVPYHHYPEPITDEHWRAAASLLDTSAAMTREARLLIDAHRQRMQDEERTERARARKQNAP